MSVDLKPQASQASVVAHEHCHEVWSSTPGGHYLCHFGSDFLFDGRCCGFTVD